MSSNNSPPPPAASGNSNANSRRRENSRNSLNSSITQLQINTTSNSTHLNMTLSSMNTSIANSNESLGFDPSNTDQEIDTFERYVASIKANNEYRPFRLNEIIPGHPWPKTIQEFIKNPTGSTDTGGAAERKITIAEITSLLCHLALIEVGFVPENYNLLPLSICTMSDAERFERFGARVDPAGYNSTASIFAWNYQVVNLNNSDTYQGGSSCKIEKDESLNKMDVTGTDTGTGEDSKKDEDSKSKKENEYRIDKYELSPPCSIIMIPKGVKIQIFCNFPGSITAGTKPFQLTADVDVWPYIESNTNFLTGLESESSTSTLRLTADEWMKHMSFNGTKFSSDFKSSFATFCLDTMNGVMFDSRGLVCLPPEVLIRIFSYTEIRSIRNTRLACRYLNNVANIPGLWRSLIRRDFGATPSVPTARFARFFNRIPYDLSQNIFDAPYDYRTIHEAQRRSSFRSGTRFDASSRLGGRMSWIPYVPPPRPYLFRLALAYDVPMLPPPPPPTLHNAVNEFFDV